MVESHSDDDDDILLTSGPTFRRSSRAPDKNKVHPTNILDEALADSERRFETLARIVEIQMNDDENNDEEVFAKVDYALSQTASGVKRRSMEDMLAQDENNDADDALGKQRRRELTTAFDSDRSSCLGIRKTIAFHFSPADNPMFYVTYTEAIRDFKRVLNQMKTKGTHHDDQTSGIISLVGPLMKNVSHPVELSIFLREGLPLLLHNHKLSTLHPDLIKWLYRVIQSAGLDTEGMIGLAADAATEGLILSMQVLGTIPDISLETFYSSLVCWKWGSTDTTDAERMKSFNNNIAGLSYLLRFWEHALAHMVERPWNPSLATHCVVALTRFAIDRFAISSKKVLLGPKTLERVLAALVDYVARQWKKEGKEEHISDWLRDTAAVVLADIETFGPGLPGSEDEDDVEAWLCYSSTVRAFSNIPEFGATLALKALESCFKSKDINSVVLDAVDALGMDDLRVLATQSLGWLALASTLAGLVQSERESAEFLQKPTRFLATIDCLFAAFEAGVRLILRQSDPTATGGKYGTVEQARTAAGLLERLEFQCLKLSKQASSLAQPHIRRADYAVKCYRYYFLTAKKHAAVLGGVKKGDAGPKVQTRLDSWIPRVSTIPSPYSSSSPGSVE